MGWGSVAAPGEAGIEAALVGSLRETREACSAAVTVLAVTAVVPAVSLAVGEGVPTVPAVDVLAEAALTEVRCALASVSARASVEALTGREAVTGTTVMAATVPEPTRSVPESAPEPTGPAPESVTVTVPTAPTRERRVLVPTERASELLERRDRGGEVVGRNSVGDLRADAVDDRAEALLGLAAFVGEGPGAIGIGHPPEFEEAVELVRRNRARIVGNGSGDAVQ